MFYTLWVSTPSPTTTELLSPSQRHRGRNLPWETQLYITPSLRQQPLCPSSPRACLQLPAEAT